MTTGRDIKTEVKQEPRRHARPGATDVGVERSTRTAPGRQLSHASVPCLCPMPISRSRP